jgi:hypothetical protein
MIITNTLRVIAIVASLVGLAACQTTNSYTETRSSSYSVNAGEKVAVGSFYEIKTSTCAVEERPAITLTKAPHKGQVTFEVVVRKPSQTNCSTVDVPAINAIYTAGNEAGADDFSYTVQYRSTNLGTWLVTGNVTIMGAETTNPYQAALPALEKAGGGKACVACFLDRYAPAEFNKAFAVSKDGAFGGRWSADMTLSDAREAALVSCRTKPEFKPENDCVIFFENDLQVWKP